MSFDRIRIFDSVIQCVRFGIRLSFINRSGNVIFLIHNAYSLLFEKKFTKYILDEKRVQTTFVNLSVCISFYLSVSSMPCIINIMLK